MNVILAGAPCEVAKSFEDSAGNTFSVQAVRWSVVNEESIALTAVTTLGSFVAGSADVTVTVPAEVNALAEGVPKGLRVVRFECQLDSGEWVTFEEGYVVQAAQMLIVGVNSFQTYAHAQMTALDLSRLKVWGSATEAQRVAALSEAFRRLRQYRYYVEVGPAQNRLADTFQGMLDELLPSEYQALPEVFKRALRLAQVAEADAILAGPDETEEKRDAGMTMDSIDTVKQMFRSTVKVRTYVSKAALMCVGRYIDYSVRTTRG